VAQQHCFKPIIAPAQIGQLILDSRGLLLQWTLQEALLLSKYFGTAPSRDL